MFTERNTYGAYRTLSLHIQFVYIGAYLTVSLDIQFVYIRNKNTENDGSPTRVLRTLYTTSII